NLHGANLGVATLRAATLLDAGLSGAELGMADLSEADLREADLSTARLYGAVLAGAQYSSGTRWPGFPRPAGIVRVPDPPSKRGLSFADPAEDYAARGISPEEEDGGS
ncbi:MAG: pentapeptide repeat-containing protein, partial [Armatimonadetes bacterium]|nr:pentapeptide repeat-containing protein [Armatimonadota bacterium]